MLPQDLLWDIFKRQIYEHHFVIPKAQSIQYIYPYLACFLMVKCRQTRPYIEHLVMGNPMTSTQHGFSPPENLHWLRGMKHG